MLKLFSISFSFLILIQSFGISVYDVAQIGEFTRHAKFHSEQYGDNLFVFISKHYGELKSEHEKKHQEEKKDHEQLPFKQCSNIVTTSAFVLNSFKKEFKVFEISRLKSSNFHYQEPTSSLHSLELFRPPQES